MKSKPEISYKRMKSLLKEAMSPHRGTKLTLGGVCHQCEKQLVDTEIGYTEKYRHYCLPCAEEHALSFHNIQQKIEKLKVALRWEQYYKEVEETAYVISALRTGLTKGEKICL